MPPVTTAYQHTQTHLSFFVWVWSEAEVLITKDIKEGENEWWKEERKMGDRIITKEGTE